MGSYTVDEHYISRFIIKNFADEHGKVRVINKSKQPIEAYSSLPEKLFFSCNLYETKNNDGTYFDRNAIEKSFADFKMDPVNWTLQFVGIPFCGHSNLSEIRGLDTNLFLRNPKNGQ